MMKGSLLGAVALFALVPAGAASAGELSFAEAKALAAESGKPLLLDFFTEW